MAEGNFPACMAEIRRHEGGFVNHPADPGGATNMGITRAVLAEWRGRAVSVAEVRALGWTEAQAIYRARYWQKIRGEDLARGVDLAVLDAAVNSGPARGVRWLQGALGVRLDGVVGVQTLAAADLARPQVLIGRICARRLGFLRGLRIWGSFGRGWTRRVAEVEAAALAMAVADAPQALKSAATKAGFAAQSGSLAAGTSGFGGALAVFSTDLPWLAKAGIGACSAFLAGLWLMRARAEGIRAVALKARLAAVKEGADV